MKILPLMQNLNLMENLLKLTECKYSFLDIHKYLTICNLRWHGWLLQTWSQLLSLLDSHISYYNLKAITFVNNYVHVCSTHYTCTLDTDTTMFGPLKINWQDVCHEYIQSEPGKYQTK